MTLGEVRLGAPPGGLPGATAVLEFRMRDYVSIADQIVQKALARGTTHAVTGQAGEALTYGQLAVLVQELSYLLHAAGVRRSDRVAAYNLDRLQFLVCILAVSRLGAATIAIGKSQEEIAALGSAWVIAPDDVEGHRTIVFPRRFSRPGSEESRFVPDGYADGGALCVVVGTSGSTGQRKFVNVTAEHLRLAVLDQIALLPGPLHATYLAVPPTTLYGLMMTLTILAQGGSLMWDSRNIAAMVLDGLTNIVAAPGTFRDILTLMGKADIRPPKMEYCVTAGSKIAPQLAEEVADRICPRFFVQYGSTELGPAAFGSTARLASTPDYSGTLAPWIEGWSIDENGARLPPGRVGRLAFRIAPPRIVAPYLTAGSADPCLYVSEDFGAVSEHKDLTIEARETERVNLGGDKTNIHALRKEAADAIGIPVSLEVVNVRSRDGFDGLVIFIVAEQEAALALADRLKPLTWSASVLRIVAVNAIPKNEFGKVDYSRLRDVAQQMVVSRS